MDITIKEITIKRQRRPTIINAWKFNNKNNMERSKEVKIKTKRMTT